MRDGVRGEMRDAIRDGVRNERRDAIGLKFRSYGFEDGLKLRMHARQLTYKGKQESRSEEEGQRLGFRG